MHVSRGACHKVIGVLAKTEKTETLCQFHNSTGFSLLKCAPFTHLFFCPDNLSGIFSALAEKYRNVQTTVIDPIGFVEDVEVDTF